MRLVRLERERLRKLIREAFAFGVVGGLNTVVNFAVFNVLILTVFADGQLKANVAATVVATTSSYFMNRHWTYRDRPKSQIRREYMLFFAFNAAGLLIELAVLGAAKYGLGITGVVALNVAKAVGVGLGTIFRFWSYRTFVFKAVRPGTHPAAASGATNPAPHPRSALSVPGPAPTGPLTDEELDPDLDDELAAELAAAELAPADADAR